MILTISGISSNAKEDYETLFELLSENQLSGEVGDSNSGNKPEDEHADIILDDESSEYVEGARDIRLSDIAEWLDEAGYTLIEVDGERNWQ